MPSVRFQRAAAGTARAAARVAEIEAAAPNSVPEILSRLPDLAAEVVRQDVASGQIYGVRSDEHDQVVGLCFALRALLQADAAAPASGAPAVDASGSDVPGALPIAPLDRVVAEHAVIRALVGVGYDAGFLRAWLRATDRREPLPVDPNEEMIALPMVGDISELPAFRDRNTGQA